MHDRRTYLRLRDIVETTEEIDALLAGNSDDDLIADRIASLCASSMKQPGQ
ncbi:MAG: hypothetical protein JNL61_04005 [Rhizobiaceae bacterium]|nr:hypothetical protein [Rhizobiaceae bacterium]